MPSSRTRRAAALVAAATAAALIPLTVAPASAAPVPASTASTAVPPVTAAASTAVGSLSAASKRAQVRWVKVDRAKVTAKRSRGSKVVARPDDGTRLRVVDRSPKLLKVRLAGGRTGWIGKRAVTTVPLKDIAGKRYTTQRIALTRNLTGSSRTVERVALGTKVTRVARTTGRDTNRVKVRIAGGDTGWVSTKRLTTRDVWGRLAQCESGGRSHIATGNGFYGRYQFTARTWRAVGGSGLPHRHSAKEQTKRAQILQERAGWGQWPHCTRKLGLR